MIVLLNQYKNARKELRTILDTLSDTLEDNEDKKLINSMIGSTTKIIEWIETGKNPYYQKGIDVNNVYHLQYLSNMDIIPDVTEQIAAEREPLELTIEQKQTLIKVFQALSDRERDCFILHVSQRKSMQEIANELSISKASVQSYIHRARGKIKELV